MDYKQQFLNVLRERGVPLNSKEQQILWEKSLIGQGLAVKNQSPQSPFWRAQKAIVGDATSKLTDTLVDVIMPNSFVMLARDEWLDKHGESRNVKRLPAVAAVGNVVITRTDSTGILDIPEGSLIQSDPVNGIVYQLALTNDVRFEEGQSEVVAVVQAVEKGSAYNLVAGYYNKFAVPIEGVSVINLDNWLVTPGQDTETNENYRLRCRDKFAALGKFHVDAVYRAIISEFPGILADNIVFDHTAPRGPGSANAYVYLQTGQVSQALLDDINNHISGGYRGNGDDLKVLALPSQTYSINGQYWLKPNSSAIHSELMQCIGSAFRQNDAYKVSKVTPNERFSFSRLASELHHHFPELQSIAFENSDIDCGVWLPVIDTLIMVPQ